MRTKPGFVLALGLAAGCVGGQTGEIERAPCVDGQTTDALALWDSPPPGSTIGFSGDELLASLPAATSATFTWADGPVATVEVALAGDRARPIVLWRPEPGFEATCDQRLEIPITLSLDTDDGELAESLEVTLTASALAVATIDHAEPAPELQGNLDLDRYMPPGDWGDAERVLRIAAQFDNAASQGELWLSIDPGPGPDSGDEVPVAPGPSPIASW